MCCFEVKVTIHTVTQIKYISHKLLLYDDIEVKAA